MGAPAAAHAHVALAEAGLVVVELVEHLVAHPLAGSGAELPLAGHLVEAGDLAGGGDAAALAHLGVVAVDDVAGGEAGAGGAGHGTGAAGDAAAVKLLPRWDGS